MPQKEDFNFVRALDENDNSIRINKRDLSKVVNNVYVDFFTPVVGNTIAQVKQALMSFIKNIVLNNSVTGKIIYISIGGGGHFLIQNWDNNEKVLQNSALASLTLKAITVSGYLYAEFNTYDIPQRLVLTINNWTFNRASSIMTIEEPIANE